MTLTCNDTLRRTADTQQDVNGRPRLGHLDGATHVTIGDESDPGTGFSDLSDQICMPGSVQNYSGDLPEERRYK